MYSSVEHSLCYGTNTIPTETKLPDAECNKPCKGDKNVSCGGDGKNIVYFSISMNGYGVKGNLVESLP